MHNLCHCSRLRPWLGQHNSFWGKFPHLWHHHPHKSTMHHQCNQFKPPPLLHPPRWDKCLHKKTVPTSLPPTINKGKLEIIGPATKAITNHREAVNNRTLPTMLRQTDQPKTPHDRMHQGATPRCTQTNRAHSVRSMSTTHLSVPTWVALSRPFRMRFNRMPTLQIKPNPTQHHKEPLLWWFKTYY